MKDGCPHTHTHTHTHTHLYVYKLGIYLRERKRLNFIVMFYYLHQFLLFLLFISFYVDDNHILFSPLSLICCNCTLFNISKYGQMFLMIIDWLILTACQTDITITCTECHTLHTLWVDSYFLQSVLNSDDRLVWSFWSVLCELSMRSSVQGIPMKWVDVDILLYNVLWERWSNLWGITILFLNYVLYVQILFLRSWRYSYIFFSFFFFSNSLVTWYPMFFRR